MKLIATKPLRYKTRRLQAGDEFDATDRLARIFVVGRLARHAPEPPATVTAPSPPVSHETATTPEPAEHRNGIDDLREEAEALGVDVDGRWGVVRLQAEIARAKRR